MKKFLVFHLFISLFIAGATFPGISKASQYTSRDNFTGKWLDAAAWTGSISPGAVINGNDIHCYGTLSAENCIDINKGTFHIVDTVIVYGDFSLMNNGVLTIDSAAVFIVFGNYISDNQAQVFNSGYMIVTGNFEMLGSNNQGVFENHGKVFLFDNSPEIKFGEGYITMICKDTAGYPENCRYGNERDLLNDPVFNFYQSVNSVDNPYDPVFIVCRDKIEQCADTLLGAEIENIEAPDVRYHCNDFAEIGMRYSITGATEAEGVGVLSKYFFNTGKSFVNYTFFTDNKLLGHCSIEIEIDSIPVITEIMGESNPICFAQRLEYTVKPQPGSKFYWTIPELAEFCSDTSILQNNTICVNFESISGSITAKAISNKGCVSEPARKLVLLQGCNLVSEIGIGNTTFCQSDTLIIYSVSKGTMPYTTYNWDFGKDANPSKASGKDTVRVIYSSGGEKKVVLTLKNNSDVSIDETTLFLQETPLGTIENASRCGSGLINLPVQLTGGNVVEYSFDTLTNQSLRDEDPPYEMSVIAREGEEILLWIRVTNSQTGCRSSWLEPAIAKAHYLPNEIQFIGDTVLCKQSFVSFSTAENYDSYLWNNEIDSKTYKTNQAGWVNLMVWNEYGCSKTDSLHVSECLNNEIPIPKGKAYAFTPNDDGFNDFWIIDNIEFYPLAKISVYNRWGALVFYSSGDYKNNWDGTDKGAWLPMDSYYYLIDLTAYRQKKILGLLTLLKIEE